MIIINNLSKNYGKKVLFENISLNINLHEKIGLIGPNGAGKSTFFQLILGEAETSSGSIRLNKNIRIGYLPQESSFRSEHTVLSELTEGDADIIRLRKEKERLESENSAGSGRYGEVLHQLEVLDYFELEHKAKKVLAGLGFKEKDLIRPINQMSGGWQMRVLLAKLLVYQYDLLLLDEPTNYLDLNAALWLKDYLSVFRGTFIMISHDKAFLNEVANYTLILENGSIFKVEGNYEHYQEIKEERRTFLLKQYKEQEKKIEQLKRFVDRFHAQPNKAASVRAKRTALERIEEIVIPPDPRQSIGKFVFPSTKRSGYMVMKLDKISKSFPDIQVYRDFDFEITQGEKAVLAGENGAGKSTLLKILAGVIDIDNGNREPGHNVSVGYFSQTRMDVLNPENTVLQEAYSAAPGYTSEESIRTILGAFLFTGDDSDKLVSVLSGGEKSRLILAKLLINPPNFLLLDEPTTHLDVDAVDALIKALNSYEGTLVFISHDIHFVRSVANVVYEVKEGRVTKYPGNFNYYLDKLAQGESEAKLDRPARLKIEKVKSERDKQKEIEKINRLKEQEVKKYNASVHSRINKLKQEQEALRTESYAKARALSDKRIYREEDTVKEYGRRLKDIEKIIQEMEKNIAELKNQLLKE
ncbi:MAG: ATP-binding cassette domain-containing protein [Candidatus Omnitrophota bacterium]|nr:ATP-binding cassette domain-containing protein [Candidatus Omnitrophota bacterium]MBU1928945.1 ATP-binding cassette domain-containing protein [Candidatus Omnitrophota bacterium]MBU2034975.1 ATP-binding cassette domain-containing protein [Candidatus Omnitrophota bacterium]MBU2257928.1 ATP-binding cassette domain-containing protein [Candidatus Omnitrophota bacterium]